jgi:hypothetical protein
MLGDEPAPLARLLQPAFAEAGLLNASGWPKKRRATASPSVARPWGAFVVEMRTTRLPPNVPAQKIRDQLVASFEGGSNYWLQSAALMKADVHPTERPWYGCPAVFEKTYEIELGYDDPSGYEGNGRGRKVITDADVRHGLEIMSRDYPDRFADVMADRGDADTADVFLQCVLFGRVVYG